MKKIITIVSLVISFQISATVYYLSPSGNDNNTGTIAAPWFTLQKAWTVISSGDTVYMRGGIYSYNIQQYLTGINGTSTNKIKIYNYPNETPAITRATVFTKPGNYWHRGMVFFSGDYFHWKGIRFTGMFTDDNQVDSGFLVYDANSCVFELLECDNNVQGMYLQNVCTDNLILNCDLHDNYSNYNNSNGGNSDGLGISYMLSTSTTNTVQGCRAWNNGDDGFDTFENLGYVLIENCWSFHNGYYYGTTTDAGDGVGFKLGSDFINQQTNILKRRVQNCIAFDNANSGIHINEAEYKTEIYNCTFYNNAVMNMNFHWTNRNHTFRNVVSFAGGNTDVEISTNSSSSNCSYGVNGNSDALSGWINSVTNADFVNLSSTGVSGARQSNGSLPIITFLHLASGSSLIDSGVNVSLPYNGTAPDRGAFEYGASTNAAPTANAGVNYTITLPINTATLIGSGIDTDGTITSYSWTQQSGPNTAILSGSSTQTLTVSGLIAGTYVFKITVTDNGGLTGTSTTTVYVTSVPPTVAITTPTLNTVLNGTVSINATATDNVSVDRVRFYYTTTGSTPTTLFTDNFNRTNSTNLGSNWTERYTASNFQINTNTMRINTNDGNVTAAYTTSGLINADYSVEAIMNFPTVNSIFAGVGGRMVNNGSNDVDGYMAYAEPGAQEVYIYKRSAGNWTQLGSYATTILANTNYTLKLELQGNTLKLFWNGLAVITTTDNTFTNMGYAGVTTGTGFTETNITWDDFKITSLGSSVTKTFIGSDNNAPYSASWNTSLVSDGSYTLIAVAYNTLGDSTTSVDVPVIVNNSIATGITQNKTMQSSFTIYPNPVINELVIETNSNSTIIITDVLNKVVKTLEVKDKIIKVDVSDLRNGVYFITETSHNTKTKSQKFIKQ